MSDEDDRPDVRQLADRRLRALINSEVSFALIAANVDRPDAAKYGTHPDGTPRYAPEWYVAQDIQTGLHEALWGALNDVLRCLSLSESGKWCLGALGHDGWHHDGDGENW